MNSHPVLQRAYKSVTFGLRWRSLKRLGGGGQGEVWLAADHETKQLTAVKREVGTGQRALLGLNLAW